MVINSVWKFVRDITFNIGLRTRCTLDSFLTIVILDIILFSFNQRWTKEKLIIKWAIIVTPFINAAFEYKYWAWLTISILFLLTQLYREKLILKIINKRKNQD